MTKLSNKVVISSISVCKNCGEDFKGIQGLGRKKIFCNAICREKYARKNHKRLCPYSRGETKSEAPGAWIPGACTLPEQVLVLLETKLEDYSAYEESTKLNKILDKELGIPRLEDGSDYKRSKFKREYSQIKEFRGHHGKRKKPVATFKKKPTSDTFPKN